MSFLDKVKAAFNGNNDAASSNLSEQAFQWANDQRARGTQIELFCGPSPAINLEAGEAVYACLPGITLMEPHSVRTYRAGSNGVSIRVAKGLSFRLGGMAGRSENHEELRSLDI